MNAIIKYFETQFVANSDPQHKEQLVCFFKNQTVNPIGVRSKEMNKLVSKFWKEIKTWDKDNIWELCNQLWETGILENGHLACKFAFKVGKRLTPDDFNIFEKWLITYIYNWAHCDDLCTKALGDILHQHPELLIRTLPWGRSDNQWLRRGFAVSLIPSLKYGNNLEHAFHVAKTLLQDEEDLVLKGYGWMLKVASQQNPNEVFEFILTHRETMPRVALRYAIEKLPTTMRNEAMKK